MKNTNEDRKQLESLLPSFLLHDFDDILEQEAKKCIYKLASQMKSGQIIDLNACMHSAIVNAIFSAAFGSSDIDSCNFELFQEILYILEKHNYSKRSSEILKPQELDIISSREKDLLLRADFRPLVHRLIELARKSKQDSIVKQLCSPQVAPCIDKDKIVHIIGNIP